MRALLGNRLVLSVVGLVTALVVCAAYLFAVVLDVPLTRRPDTVTVHLPRTGGLFEGSSVTYRGVRVGTVTDVGLGKDGGVEATVSLRDGVEVPRSSRATVRSLSPVGEQFLDFRPERDDGPYLADGDEIEARAADLPVSLATAAGSLDNLLSNVDGRDVRVVLRELASATDGSGEDLETLLGSAERLTGSLDAAWPETRRLLENGEQVGELVDAHRTDLIGVSRSARRFAAWLEAFDPRFRDILTRAPEDLDTVGLLVEDLDEVLPPTLRALVAVGDLLYDREPHVRQLTRTLRYGASRFASAFDGGWLRIDLLLQGQAQCRYGTPHRDPTSTAREPFNRGGTCAMGDGVRRGAEHAPPPLDR